MRILIGLILFILPTITFAETLDNKIIQLFGKTNGKEIIKQCESAPIDKKHCKIVHSFIAGNESTFGKNAYRHNIYGINKPGLKFNSDIEAIGLFQNKYNKWYFKPKKYTPDKFYLANAIPITRYCTSEISSNSKIGCPNGSKHAWNIYNLLINLK